MDTNGRNKLKKRSVSIEIEGKKRLREKNKRNWKVKQIKNKIEMYCSLINIIFERFYPHETRYKIVESNIDAHHLFVSV